MRTLWLRLRLVGLGIAAGLVGLTVWRLRRQAERADDLRREANAALARARREGTDATVADARARVDDATARADALRAAHARAAADRAETRGKAKLTAEELDAAMGRAGL